ncbi:MAG: sigma-70 family RNA polymerase sigma factor [Synechococcales bacterium]|nr:sigma-70 family RNA polymerase sigma factor [Synechococcales bacterium]
MAPDLPLPHRPITAQSSDGELVDALQSGQTGALSVLYDRYASLVFGVALRILQAPEEAEDVTQEVFLKIWHRAELYQPGRGSFSNFLLTMTRSRAIDKLRSRGARFRFLQRWQATILYEVSFMSPLESVSMEERSQLVRSALVELSDHERQILEIAYYEGLSQSEIAARLNLPLGTVKSRSRSGLRKLRHVLKHSL